MRLRRGDLRPNQLRVLQLDLQRIGRRPAEVIAADGDRPREINLVALRHFGFGRGLSGKRNILLDIITPIMGFLFCLVIFRGLQQSTLVAGSIWLGVGGLYLILKTKGLRTKPLEIDFNEL